jgi:GGDEF domain-containing protein
VQGFTTEYTTEVDDVLWSLQTLLIREAEVVGTRGAVPPALEAPATWIPCPEPGDPGPIRVVESAAALTIEAPLPPVVATQPTPLPPVVSTQATPASPVAAPTTSSPVVAPPPFVAAEPVPPMRAVTIEIPPEPVAAIGAARVTPVRVFPAQAPAPTPAPPRASTSAPEAPEWARSRPAATAPAMHDPSTGALSLHALEQALELRGSHLARWMVTVDIAPLPEVRRQHGDETADAILRVIVEAVPFVLRAQDQVFRTGIDELTLLMPDSDLADAAVLCLRVQMAVKDVLVRRELPGVILSVRLYVSAAA